MRMPRLVRMVTVVYTLNGCPAGQQTLRLRARRKERHRKSGPIAVKHLGKWWEIDEEETNPTVRVDVWKPNIYFEPERGPDLPAFLSKQALAPVK